MGLKQETCHTPDCNNLQVSMNNNYKGQPGVKCFRKWCHQCHSTRTAAKHGLTRLSQVVAKNAGMTESQYAMKTLKKVAKKAGFDSVTHYKNSKHPYRKHRKDYCENIDGRLGFICTYPKKPAKEVTALLQVDHISGNPSNNRKNNLQTLCANCHTYKTHTSGDCLSPGRKTLRKT